MGELLFDEVPEFVDNERKIDVILGWSVREVCLSDPRRELGQTQFTQPCLYVVNALQHFREVATGMTPELVAGHSLGEYNALLAADVFDFLTGLRLVKRRGELMAQVHDGGMAAVLDLPVERITRVLAEEGLDGVDIANLNSDSQCVVAGPKAQLERAAPALQKAGARACVPLPVSAAFHSRYMQPVAASFADFLSGVEFRSPGIPVIANATAEPYPTTGAGAIQALLVRQIAEPVRWTQSVRRLLTLGATTLREVGPGNILSRLVQQIQTTPAAAPPAQVPVDALAQAPVASPHQHPVGARSSERPAVAAERLGDAAFRRDYGLKLAYYAGAMYKGIASKELIVAMGRAGLMGILGTGGLSIVEIEAALDHVRKALGPRGRFGANLLADISHPDNEATLVDLYLRKAVSVVEASAFMMVSPALVRYRLAGIRRGHDGRIVTPNRVIAKVSRPEVAEAFMDPAPKEILEQLLAAGLIDVQQATLGVQVPVAQDICVEADSAGHTDQGVAYALMPAMLTLRERKMREHGYAERLRLGAAGGIGTPAAAAAAFVLGADFIVTGSVNQCTVEAGTSDVVKDMLQDMNVQDTEYAPAGDMFEFGARIQVLRKGVVFPARANKLYELYQRHEALEDIDVKTREQIQQRYFKRSFEQVWEETHAHYQRTSPATLDAIERHPKRKMALMFRWYFVHSTRLALQGDPDQRVNYQVHCGPALGAFNEWVKGSALENWRNRKVADIGLRIMEGAARLLEERFATFHAAADP